MLNSGLGKTITPEKDEEIFENKYWLVLHLLTIVEKLLRIYIGREIKLCIL